jgi:hypothetical protein
MRALLAALLLASAACVVLLPGAAADPRDPHSCTDPADVLCDGGFFPQEVCALYIDDPVFHGLCFPVPCIDESTVWCNL